MKILQITTLFTVFILFTNCATKSINEGDKLSQQPWELEYITGPRIAFQGLYPDDKPTLTFNVTNNTVLGSDSCNGYATTYTQNNDAISFDIPKMSTLRYCGEGEGVFRKTMEKINKFIIDEDGKLNLKMDDVVMMRFKKAE